MERFGFRPYENATCSGLYERWPGTPMPGERDSTAAAGIRFSCVTANAIAVRSDLCHPARRTDELSLPGCRYTSAPLDVRDSCMNDTVRIKRPICCRRHEDLGGRIKPDSLGNTIKVKTRVHDSSDDIDRSWLKLVENLERSREG
jgi:hypothetical protein